jgi:hypothetical protein
MGKSKSLLVCRNICEKILLDNVLLFFGRTSFEIFILVE